MLLEQKEKCIQKSKTVESVLKYSRGNSEDYAQLSSWTVHYKHIWHGVKGGGDDIDFRAKGRHGSW